MIIELSTREEWLILALLRIKEKVFANYNVPDNIRISCGFCKIGKPEKKSGFKIHVLGICCPSELSTGGFTEIFIDPILDDSLRVLDVIAHEMIHAILGSGKGHGKEFKKIALDIGLEGPMTSTVAGVALESTLQSIIQDIGQYPHKAYQLIESETKETEEKEKPEKIINLRCLRDKILVKTHELNLTERGLIFKCPVCDKQLTHKSK